MTTPASSPGAAAPPSARPFVRVDHVSIAVPCIDDTLAFFRRHFPIAMRWEKCPGYTNDFNWCDFTIGQFVIELIEPAGRGGFANRFLTRRGPGLHHMSLEVDPLVPLIARMETDGLRIVDRFETDGQAKAAFISPRSAFGVLIQLWQLEQSAPLERPPIGTYRLRSGETIRTRPDHVSIAVRDIQASLRFFGRHFPFRLRRAPHLGYDGSFLVASFYLSGYKVEIIQNTPSKSGFVQRFIDRHGEGFHHLSIDVDRLDPYVAQLEADGVRVVDKANIGGGWKTAFISPRSAHGVLIQLWQPPDFPRT